VTDSTPTETPDSAPEGDAEAPFGRRADGTPKKGPGGRPAGKKRTPFRKRATAATSRPASAPSRARKPNTPRSKPVDYTKTATEVVQLAAGLVGMVPAAPFKLDALVLHMRAEEIAECVNESAQELAWLGGLLDRYTQYTPWAKPAMLGASLLMQIAVNHGLVSTEQGRAFGAVPREELAMMAQGMAPPPPPAEAAPEPGPAEAEPVDTNGHQLGDDQPPYANVYMHPAGV
jgi:hypothetical protein